MLEAAGATLRRMSLIIYRGIVLIATIAVVFQANPRETTNVMSEDQRMSIVPVSGCSREVRIAQIAHVPKNSGRNTMLMA